MSKGTKVTKSRKAAPTAARAPLLSPSQAEVLLEVDGRKLKFTNLIKVFYPQEKYAKRDVIIIGGGHNGLVTAFYLAKAGFKPLILERRAQVGGCAITDEFHPGFRCSTLSHSAGPIRPDIVRDMQLEKHGLRFITPDTCVTAVSPDGRALSLYQDESKSAQSIAAFSQKDAAKYPEFAKSLSKISKVIAEALATTPPDIDHPTVLLDRPRVRNRERLVGGVVRQ